jgi:ABC-2 type transport system permease protein
VSRDLLAAELLLLRRDRAFLLGCALACLLALYAVWSGLGWQQSRALAAIEGSRAAAQAVRREAGQLAAIETGELPISAAAAAGLPHVVRTEFALPMQALSGLAIGEAELRPTYAAISATTRAHEIFRFQEVDNPVLLGWGRFDLAFVLIYLLPLLLAGLGCSVLSADRETRTLQMVLSQPVTAARLATLRITLRGAALAFATALGAGIAFLLAAPDRGLGAVGGTALLPALSLVAVTLAWLAFWAALTLWVVARNRSSESNALTLIVVWTVLVLVLPAISTLLARHTSPVPSRLEYIVSARAAENAASQQGRMLLQNYLLDHPELEATRGDAVSPFIKTFVLVQREVERTVAPVVARFESAERAQRMTRDTLRWLSPRDLAAEAMLTAAGNDAHRHARFEEQARQLRIDWLAAVQNAIVAGRRLGSAEYAALPRAEFREPPRGSFVARQLAAVLALLAFAALAALGARRSFRVFSPG